MPRLTTTDSQHPRACASARSLGAHHPLRRPPVDDGRDPQQDHERRVPRRVEQVGRDQQVDLLLVQRSGIECSASTQAKKTRKVSELKIMRPRLRIANRSRTGQERGQRRRAASAIGSNRPAKWWSSMKKRPAMGGAFRSDLEIRSCAGGSTPPAPPAAGCATAPAARLRAPWPVQVRFLDVAVAADVFRDRRRSRRRGRRCRGPASASSSSIVAVIGDQLALHAALGGVAEHVERGAAQAAQLRQPLERGEHPRAEFAA